MKRIILIFSLILLVLFSALSIQAKPAQAKSYPQLAVSIVKNPITKHMYFAPTYPRCITAAIVSVKFVNTTNTRATIQEDNGAILSVPPHSTKYGYYDGYYRWVVWQMLESNVYGGNAWIYFNSCG